MALDPGALADAIRAALDDYLSGLDEDELAAAIVAAQDYGLAQTDPADGPATRTAVAGKIAAAIHAHVYDPARVAELASRLAAALHEFVLGADLTIRPTDGGLQSTGSPPAPTGPPQAPAIVTKPLS